MEEGLSQKRGNARSVIKQVFYSSIPTIAFFEADRWHEKNFVPTIFLILYTLFSLVDF